MTNPETPIFTRTFDLLTWLLPRTNDFPRAHRHSMTRRGGAASRRPAPFDDQPTNAIAQSLVSLVANRSPGRWRAMSNITTFGF